MTPAKPLCSLQVTPVLCGRHHLPGCSCIPGLLWSLSVSPLPQAGSGWGDLGSSPGLGAAGEGGAEAVALAPPAVPYSGQLALTAGLSPRAPS